MTNDVQYNGRRVLVTGAGGFIGSHVVERLLDEGARVTALLRYTSRAERGCLEFLGPERLKDVELILGDVRDSAAVHDLVTGADIIFHLAALIGIPYSYQHPQEVIDTNAIGTANILLAAREHEGVERVVLTSTSEVYGTAQRVPMDEEHPLQPQSPYAATKIAADALGLSFQRSFSLPVTIVRPFNAYGPRQSARAVIATIISQALAGGELRLGSTETTRDFTYVEDTADAFLRIGAAAGCVGEVVNVGTGTEVKIGDVVRLVGSIVGRDLSVRTDDQRLRPKASEVSRLLADTSKAKRLAGWEAKVSLEDGLRRTVDWIREHPALYQPGAYAV
jgi:dTDP-glucose 4,6-dehydratase